MTQKIRPMIQEFEDEVLEACLKLSMQENADNARFIDEALSILERTEGTISIARLGKLGRLGGPILEQLDSGASPKWSNRLARILADPRFSPLSKNWSKLGLAIPHWKMGTEGHDDEKKSEKIILRDAETVLSYAISWGYICIAMDAKSQFDNLEAKRSIVSSIYQLLPRFDAYHDDFEIILGSNEDIDLDVFRIEAEDFLFSNRSHLKFDSNSFLLISSLHGRLPELVRKNWKGSPGTMNVYDLIPINLSDIPALSTHFGSWKPNFHRGTLFTGSSDDETNEIITPETFNEYSHPETSIVLFVVSNVDNMSQTVDLCTYPEWGPTTKTDEKGPSVEEVREWLVTSISEQDGFIRLSLLGHDWKKERGITLRAALKPHDLTTKTLIQKICEETGDYFLTDIEDSGGRIRRLGPNEDLSLLSQLESSTGESRKWLDEWKLPDAESMANTLVEVSEDLYSLSSEDWDSLRSNSITRFYRLIVTQAINTENYRRGRLGLWQTDISPLGLLKNMIDAITNKVKFTDLNHEYLEENLLEIRVATENALALHKDGDSGVRLSWWSSLPLHEGLRNYTPESSTLPPSLTEWPMPISPEEKALRDLEAKSKQIEEDSRRKFGPVVSSAYLTSDYISSLRQSPESFEDFRDYVNESYRNRVRSSRTRVLGHKKSDEQVWKVYQDNRSRSPEEVILELLRRAGISEEKSLDHVEIASATADG